jgi:hypothetical protein
VTLLNKRKRAGSARRRGLRLYTVVRCPKAGHQVGWCRGLCEPIGNRGLCGRVAPHSLQGRTQQAIAAYQARCKAAAGADKASTE